MSLLDEFDPKFYMNSISADINRAIMAGRYKARRFIFAPDTTDAVADMLRDHPNIFLDNFQFALPTYDHMYMQVNMKLFLQRLGSKTTADLFGHDNEDTDVGFLFSEGKIYIISRTAQKDQPSAVPHVYTMNDHTPIPGFLPTYRWMHDRPKNKADIEKALERARANGADENDLVQLRADIENQRLDNEVLAHLLGTTLTNPRATITLDQANELTRRFEVWSPRGIDKKAFMGTLMYSMGEVRVILSLLLWLNQPSLVELSYKTATRRWWHAKQLAYAAHHVVKLRPNLSRKKIVKAFGGARSPRRHEVRAFWRNFRKTPGCIHEWPLYADEYGHFHCGKCPQWRTRVRQHERGDATIGFVTKEYRA